jgi:hypothetical protein
MPRRLALPRRRKEGACSTGLNPTARFGPEEDITVRRRKSPPTCTAPTHLELTPSTPPLDPTWRRRPPPARTAPPHPASTPTQCSARMGNEEGRGRKTSLHCPCLRQAAPASGEGRRERRQWNSRVDMTRCTGRKGRQLLPFFTTTSYFVTEKRSVAIWAYLPHPMEWQAQIYLHVKRAQIYTIFQVCQIIVKFFSKFHFF